MLLPLLGKTRTSLIVLLGIALGAHAVYFAHAAAELYIQMDVFRHLRDIVLPVMEGSAPLSSLWSNHHPIPILHLIQIVNLKFFDFQLQLELFLGLAFQFATAAMLMMVAASSAAMLSCTVARWPSRHWRVCSSCHWVSTTLICTPGPCWH